MALRQGISLENLDFLVSVFRENLNTAPGKGEKPQSDFYFSPGNFVAR
jgi:hypothetical protein